MIPSGPGHAMPTLNAQRVARGTPGPGSRPPAPGPASRALPSGTRPARPPSPWSGASVARGLRLHTLQPHRLLAGHHLLQLFGDPQQLFFQAHVGPRRPAGLGARGSGERQGASGTGRKHIRHSSPTGAGRAPPSTGGWVAGTKYRLQGLPGQRLPGPGGSRLWRKDRAGRRGFSPPRLLGGAPSCREI